MDAEYNKQYTFDKVNARLYEQKERELFFAWYSRGSILVEMNDYWGGAAQSFDELSKSTPPCRSKNALGACFGIRPGPIIPTIT